MDERTEKLYKLARDVLRLSRNTLLVNLRFLDMALSQLVLVPTDEDELCTDGQYLLYGAEHVLRRYKQNRATPVRNYLHMVLHCVFRHMYIHSLADKVCWDLACDIAAEYCISTLYLRSTDDGLETLRQKEYDRLQAEVGQLTAEKLYRYFLDQSIPPMQLAELRGLFYADNHEIWYMSDEEKAAAYGIGAPQSAGGNGEDRDENGGGSEDADTGETVTITAPLSAAEAEQLWKDISERMQTDMETFSKMQGDKAGGTHTEPPRCQPRKI